MTYHFSKTLQVPFDAAVERVTAALQREGFGILTEIDVQATLKQKLDADFRRYVILGACNPPLAHRALLADLDVGLLLPCNVIVYEEDGGSVISVIDPLAMLGVLGESLPEAGCRRSAGEAAPRGPQPPDICRALREP